MSRTRLILLPGLGADPRLFNPQREAFSDLISPNWLLPRDRETLPSYAERLAEQVRAQVPAGQPLILGGVSFGGMLASEMSRVLKPAAVVMIASALSPSEIDPKLRHVATAGQWIPNAVGARSKQAGRLFIRQLGPMRLQDRQFLETMIDAVPFSFIKWAGKAIFDWPGAAPTCPVIRIHGDSDRIIPLPKSGVAHIIRRGGHVPNISHAAEINAIIADVLSRHAKP